MWLHPIGEINHNIQYEKHDECIWYLQKIRIVVFSVFGLWIVFDDVFRFVHHPVKCLHVQLRLQLFAHHCSNASIVLVQPAFLFMKNKYRKSKDSSIIVRLFIIRLPLVHLASPFQLISAHKAPDWYLRILGISFQTYAVYPDRSPPKHSRFGFRIAPFCRRPALNCWSKILI